MLFNSFSFAIFLPVVFILYWFVTNKNLRLQNLLLLAASYFFYACWDYRFLFLLIFSTALDYFTGLKMGSDTTKNKRLWLLISVVINLGFLATFKYYNFFASSLAELFSQFGLKGDIVTIKVILPVGISFYTFHGLSYVFDVYHKKISSERNFVDYAVFVSFFPLLVAGPIERATHLLPQVKKPRVFNYSAAVDGMRQILWGLFKKVVIADTCAEYVNSIFANYESFGGSTLALGVFLFAFQIYCDFSGYSDIALGSARLLGIDLLRNFAFPYFSRDIAEFWRRWHISLTTWFRDYLYIPLGGNRGPAWKKIRLAFLVFLVSGFWHGANWTFIAWGLLNALFFIPLYILNINRTHLEIVAKGKLFPSIKEFLAICTTFCMVTLAWIFFRAESVRQAFDYIKRMFSASLFKAPDTQAFVQSKINIVLMLLLIAFLLVTEWLGRENQYALAGFEASWKRPARWAAYSILLATVFLFMGKEQQFIYFQF